MVLILLLTLSCAVPAFLTTILIAHFKSTLKLARQSVLHKNLQSTWTAHLNWICHRTEISPITLQCLFPKMALPASLFPTLLLSECILEVVSYNRSQVFSSTFHSQVQFYYLWSQYPVPATAVRVRKLSSAADGNGCLPFWVQRDETIVSPQFSFPCGVSHLRLFAKPNFPKAKFFSCFLSFFPSLFKSEMTAWSKLLEILSGLCGWACCQHSYWNPGDFKLTDDKGFRQWLSGCAGTLGST